MRSIRSPEPKYSRGDTKIQHSGWSACQFGTARSCGSIEPACAEDGSNPAVNLEPEVALFACTATTRENSHEAGLYNYEALPNRMSKRQGFLYVGG